MRSRSLLYALLIYTAAMTALTVETRAESRWTTLNGTKIHFYDHGRRNAKAALVLIHGWACNADFWNGNIRGLSDLRVIAIDLPGHGRSAKPKLNYTMELFANSINAVMKTAGIRRAVLVGHSMGTPVARQFYRIYPERTAGIVVVDGALVRLFPKSAREASLAPLRAHYKENAAKFIDGMLTPVKDEQLKKTIRDSMLATPDYVGIGAMDAMYDEKIWTEDVVNVPILAIMSPAPFWPKDLRDKFAVVAPDMDFRLWSDVSHFLHMEKPDEFNQVVKDFVKKRKLL